MVEPPWKLGNWVGPHLSPAAVNRPWGAEAEDHAGSGQGSGLGVGMGGSLCPVPSPGLRGPGPVGASETLRH